MSASSSATPEKIKAFLTSLASAGSVKRAAEVIGVNRKTVYNWRKADEEFAAAWDDALEDGTDALEDEAVRRGFEGSDTLLIFMLKARRPEKYRERSDVRVDGSYVVGTEVDGYTRDDWKGEFAPKEQRTTH